MAGSRLHKFGTIFTRVSGLLKSKAIQEDGKPLWYDVYKAFPPQLEPNMFRPVPEVNLINILYPEDYIRARFYDTYGSPGLIDMTNQISNYKCLSQRFVDKYIEIARKSHNTLTDDQLFKATEEELISEGFQFKYEENLDSNQFKSTSSHVKEKPRTSLNTSSMTDIAISHD